MTDDTTTAADRMGAVLRDGDRIGLRYERRFAHPPERVWRALTESDQLRHWFPADIVGERRAGAAVSMPFWPEAVERAGEELEEMDIDLDDAVLPGEIRAWEPPRVFELVWGNGADRASDLLRFELTPTDGGTRMVFTTWLGEPGPHGHAGTGAGYQVCLEALEQTLDGRPVVEPDADAVAALEAAYAEML